MDTDRHECCNVVCVWAAEILYYWHTVWFSHSRFLLLIIGCPNKAVSSDKQFVEMETKKSSKYPVVYSLTQLLLVKTKLCALSLHV